MNSQTVVDLTEQIVYETLIAGREQRLQIVIRRLEAQSAPETVHQTRGCAGRLHVSLLIC